VLALCGGLAVWLIVVGTVYAVLHLRGRLIDLAGPIARDQAVAVWQTQSTFLVAIAAFVVGVIATAFLLVARQLRSDELLARITAEKAEAERARALAEAGLLKQERFSVLGKMTATVAHELRNPLSAIRNSIYAVRAAADGTGITFGRPMERIERSIARCDDIIRDLVEYSGGRDLRPRPVALDAWLAETLDRETFPADIVISRRLGAGRAIVALDDGRLRRAVLNVIENACQAIADGDPNTTQRAISVATLANAEAAEIMIEDFGPGIAPEIMPRIFDPLFSTKRFGTGLGLPTVKQIVEQHGGSINITSEPGCGTAVQIRLPLEMAKRRAA